MSADADPLVTAWMASPAQRRLSPGSQRRNRATAGHFARWLGARRLVDATPDDVEAWIEGRGPLAPDSRSVYLGSLQVSRLQLGDVGFHDRIGASRRQGRPRTGPTTQ